MLAGYSKRIIDPAVPVHLAGFDARKELSCGVHDSLYVTVTAFIPDEGKPFIICAFDLLGTGKELSDSVCAEVARAAGTDPERVWVCATHTHAAPSSVFERWRDEAYIQMLTESAAAAAQEACSTACEVTAYCGKAGIKGAASRRDSGPDASGYEMPVFVIRLKGARDIALVRMACHCTVLDENNRLISKDLAGAIGEALPGDAAYQLINGACGNISTRYTRKSSDFEELRRLGSVCAEQISAAAAPVADGFGRRIDAFRAGLTLKRQRGFREAEKQMLISAITERMENTLGAAEKREYAARLAVLNRPVPFSEQTRTVNVSMADFGPVCLIGLPFEMNDDEGAALEAHIGARTGKQAAVVCYTCGYEGYLPRNAPISADSSYQDIESGYSYAAISRIYGTLDNMAQ